MIADIDSPTTSELLLEIVRDAIIEAGTAAGANVFKPGDWPTQNDQYPIVKLRLVNERRVSLGRGGPPEFTTTATIRLQGEVSAPARVDDLGASDVEASLWSLKREIDCAIVNSYPLTRLVQQIASMTSQLAFSSESATHLAGIQTDADLEFYEGPENFAPIDAVDLREVDIPAVRFPSSGTIVSLPEEQS